MVRSTVNRFAGVREASIALASLALAFVASAQQSPSGIAGVVRDTSGAVLPGVTVEASSPALIEKVRTVVTDGEGRYNIVNLRPGLYAVSFTLAGFSSVRREGIELTVGFTATVNAELSVGALADLITVTGASPLVDVQNTRQQNVLPANLLTVVPTGTTTILSIIALTPGYTGNATVGGSAGGWFSNQTKGQFHGKLGSHVDFDGGRIDNFYGNGDAPGYIYNSETVEQSVIESGGANAENNSPNVLINLVPKDGSNAFRSDVIGMFTNSGLQSGNLNDALRARGLSAVPHIVKQYDAGVSVGGPILTDRLWFFGSFRRWGVRNQAAGLYWNATQGTPFFTPDYSRPAERVEKNASNAIRLTWQASPKNKVSTFIDIKRDCICLLGGTASALGTGAVMSEESGLAARQSPSDVIQVTWTSPRTSRLLFEAGVHFMLFGYKLSVPDGVSEDDVTITEQSTNFQYGSAPTKDSVPRRGNRYAQRFSMSYVTGSHALKVGIQNEFAYNWQFMVGLGRPGAKGVSYTFLNQVPVSITQRILPLTTTSWQKPEMGIYAQDHWTISRLSLDYGFRFDWYNGEFPQQVLPAGLFSPARTFAAVHNKPDWKDINPRVGVAYDLFKNGRTALKASFGRYVSQSGSSALTIYNPINTSVLSVNRSWTDNGNYVPDCDLANFAANGECGAISNLNFGKGNPNATQYANDVIFGWGKRPFTWDFSTEVQQQLGAHVSLTPGYYHSWDGNFTVTDNNQVTPQDYNPYCITAPVDSSLPSGGGYQVCGLYDVSPAKFGLVSNVVKRASDFGTQHRHNDFFGVQVNTRFDRNISFGGGVDAGRTVQDNCFVVDSPQQLVNCHVINPLAGTLQTKFHGSYPLPANFLVAATFQNLPGFSYTADYPASTAQVALSLGRPLAGNTRSVVVPLIAPNTQREPRYSQLDLRLSRIFNVGTAKLQANLDAFNALNASPVLGSNTTYGSRWRNPTLLLNGRTVQLSGRLTF